MEIKTYMLSPLIITQFFPIFNTLNWKKQKKRGKMGIEKVAQGINRTFLFGEAVVK
jgi:hypothetical protein